MYSPEYQQVEICLLKTSLSGIEKNLAVQEHTGLHALEVENKQRYHATIHFLRTVRSYCTDLDKLRQDKVCLTAKRLRLKSQCEGMFRANEVAQSRRQEVDAALNAEEEDDMLLGLKYVDSLKEKADTFRRAQKFYDEGEVNANTKIIEGEQSSLETEAREKENSVKGRRHKLAQLSAKVPEDILDIFGQNRLEDQLKKLSGYCATLEEKINN